MLSLMLMSLIFIILSLMILLVNFFISKKLFKNREKSLFECEFDLMSQSRMPFSIQFLMISLIFLIFDIEITLLIPLIYMYIFLNKIMMFSSFLFLMILIIGLFIEYLDLTNWYTSSMEKLRVPMDT